VKNFLYLSKKYFEKGEYSASNSLFFYFKNCQNTIFFFKLQKFATIALNMNNEKWCLRFSTFIFMILPNLAKHSYG